jgi:hypothetical protein
MVRGPLDWRSAGAPIVSWISAVVDFPGTRLDPS